MIDFVNIVATKYLGAVSSWHSMMK